MSLVLVVARPPQDPGAPASPLAGLLGAVRTEVDRVRRAPPGSLLHGTLDELRAVLGPDDVTDASVAYATDAPGVAAAIDRAVEMGAGRIAVLPVSVAVEDGETPAPSADTLAEVQQDIERIGMDNPDVEILLVAPSAADAPRLGEVLGILRAEGSDEPALLAAALDRAFDGDTDRFGRFMRCLQEGMPAGTRIALRGSAVQGASYKTGEPFDAKGRGTSDLDLVLLGDAAMAEWKPEAFYIAGLNTWPLDDERRWVAPGLEPSRVAAQRVAGRPVALQSMAPWFLDLRSGLQGTPYVLLDA